MRAISCCQSAAVYSPTCRRRNPSPFLACSVCVSTAEPELTEAASSPGPLLRRRRLILLRHAESALPDRSLRDHDRPLNKSGRADAISVSRKLQQMGWIPKLILSSDATRTKETLKIMQECVKEFSEARVYFMPSFYSIAAMDGQTAEHLQKVICQYTENEIFTVMCIGHNRGWEEAASMFSGSSVELKTCNAALLEATGKSWNEAFGLTGLGGWKLEGIVKPNSE
ncbi:hypothetical protein AXF42_Ash004510 [Apostasia shenzhenica]|uniref:Uncharacterized protein n=1 Tax=Apostasia shenzhenica TaxID=1088818 RepID=A0A2I0BGV4_9ASPA|nr:hypothetical protein AXF42_Ash004510 [Apostasia shenzhenica]